MEYLKQICDAETGDGMILIAACTHNKDDSKQTTNDMMLGLVKRGTQIYMFMMMGVFALVIFIFDTCKIQ